VFRCKENTGLSALFTTLLHHHIRIADALHSINSHWEDEKLFQEAKRIVIAEIQHITLTEFLPVVLGVKAISIFGLKPAQQFYMGYSTKESAEIFNEVATAVLPAFATMVSVESVSNDFTFTRIRSICESIVMDTAF